MATGRRDWSRLGERQKKRYLAAGRKQGLSEGEIIQHYESGGSLAIWRGQSRSKRAGVSERTWRRLMRAAQAAELSDNPGEVLESLVGKGFQPDWILDELWRQENARSQFRSAYRRALRRKKLDAGYQPGRARYKRRNLIADIELYYYH